MEVSVRFYRLKGDDPLAGAEGLFKVILVLVLLWVLGFGACALYKGIKEKLSPIAGSGSFGLMRTWTDDGK